MMPPRRFPRRLHPLLAILVAGVLHAGLLIAIRSKAPQQGVRAARALDAEIELLLDTEGEESAAGRHASAESAAARSAATDTRTARATTPRARSARADTAPRQTAPEESVAAPGVEPEPAGEASAGPAAQPIDLGLNGGVRRTALLEGWVELPSAFPKPPSDGGLRAGLAALDAQRGQSRSSAVNHAGYEAARRFAPPTGMGIFDILTDEHGVVLSVTLASAPADEARWQQVGEELHALLEQHPFRVPPGAKGLAARVRIETGDLAKDVADRFRTPRGAALGQDTSHPREARNESTRARLEPGELSPTLGVTIAGGGGDSRHIRVVLLAERPL